MSYSSSAISLNDFSGSYLQVRVHMIVTLESQHDVHINMQYNSMEYPIRSNKPNVSMNMNSYYWLCYPNFHLCQKHLKSC